MTWVVEVAQIRTARRQVCPLCRSPQRILHADVMDRLFGAPGRWTFAQCTDPACRLIWLDPMPLHDELWKAYGRYYTHETRSAPGFTTQAARSVYRAVASGYLRHRLGYRIGVGPGWLTVLWPLAHLLPGGGEEIAARAMFLPAPAAGARVLDIGCGDGQTLMRLKLLGWDAEGIDTDPRAVEQGRAKGLSINLGQVESHGYSADAFDAVYANHVIEHVVEPERMLIAINRILKAGGRLIVVTPNADSWGHARFGQDWRGLEPPRHLYLFTLRAISDLVRRSGLRLVSARTLVKGVRYISAGSRSLRRSRRDDAQLAAPTGGEQLKAVLDQIAARMRILRQPAVGEEILVVAEKSNGGQG